MGSFVRHGQIKAHGGVLRRVQTVLTFVLSIALVVLASGQAWATTGSNDPGTAPTLCSSGSADGLSMASHYLGQYVPAGATVTFADSGTATYTQYGGVWRLDDVLRVDIWLNGAVVGGTWNAIVRDGSGPGDYPFNFVAGSWTNTTGQDVVVGLQTYVQRGIAGTVNNWTLSTSVSGGTPGSCLSLRNSEMFGANQALGEQCPQCHGGTDYSVDSLTGNEHWTMPGIRLASRGSGIDEQFAYNSLGAGQDGAFGHGWVDAYGMSIAPSAFGEDVIQEGGATVPFVHTGSSYVAPQKFDATLVQNSDGSWIFTRHHDDIFTFDSNGRLTSIADRNGYATALTYGADGLDHVVDDAGHRLNYTWSNGHVDSITDVSDAANPRTMQFGYTNGDLTSFGDIGGGTWVLGYDDAHRLTSVQSPRLVGTTAMRQFHYDAQGRVDWEQDPVGNRTSLFYDDPQAGSTRIVDPAGNTRVDTYDNSGQRISVTEGYGTADASTTQYTYDPNSGMVTDRVDGRGKHWLTEYTDPNNPFSPTKTTDPMGRTRYMAWTANGQIDTITDAHGVKTKYYYDGNGNPTQITTAYSNPATAATVSVQYKYDDPAHLGDVTSMIDARTKTWTYVHDPATGLLKQLSDPLGNTTSWTYNPEGWMATGVSPMGNATGNDPTQYTTSYGYNAYGETNLVQDAYGHQTVTKYDANGNVDQVTDATGRVTKYTWTDDDQLWTVTRGYGTPDARTTTYTYTPDGHLFTRSPRPGTTWTMHWDALGRMSKQTDPNGNSTTYAYDATGNVLSTTVADGTSDATTTTNTYDADGRLATSTAGAGSSMAVTTTVGYDVTAGMAPCTGGPATAVYCSTLTRGGLQTVRFLDAHDRVVQVNRPGGMTSTWTYNPDGRLATSTTPSNTTTQYSYFDNGLLQSTTNGSPVDDTSYTYWPDSLRKSMTDSTGTTIYDYDHNRRLTDITDGTHHHVGYSYDDAGRLWTLKYPDGRVVSYGYDGAGQANTLTDAATGGKTTTFGYNASGALHTTNLPNGDTITAGQDNADQTNQTTLTGSGGTVLAGLTTTYNHAEQISSETGQAGLNSSHTYGYDALNRLASDTTATGTTHTTYDPSGNATTFADATQVFNDPSQLQTSASPGGSPVKYQYDGDGNRTRAGPGDVSDNLYHFDAADRMTSATTPAPAAGSASQFHPVDITRLVDTRNGTGSCTPSPCATVAANGTLTVQVGGNGGVPASGVSAVVLTITTLNATAAGSAAVYAADKSKPDGRAVSITNGTIQSNTVITGTSSGGAVKITPSVATDLLIDVSGWYATPSDTSGSVFHPIDGTKILDTRDGTGTCTPSPCAQSAALQTTTVQVNGSGGIPTSGVTAVAFYLSAFNPSGAGYVQAWTAGETRPNMRNVSYLDASNATGLVVVQPSAQGKVSLYTNKATDLAIDVAGYYTTTDDGTGSIFVPYSTSVGTNQRVLDTRSGVGTCNPSPCATVQTGSNVTVTVAGHGGVPANATAVVLDATAWNPPADGGLFVWPADASVPPLRSASFWAGVNSSGVTQTALSANGQVKLKVTGSPANLTLDVEGWFVPAQQTTTYTYNGDGIRTSKTTADGTVTHFTYAPAGPGSSLPQLLTDGTTDYLYGPDGTPLESTPTSGSSGPTTYYMSDPNGSTRVLTGSDGAITATYNYTPFGSVSAKTGTTTTPLQYGGGYTDAETGYIYLLNRYYDPATGQFTSVDPLIDATQAPYSYTDNDPLNQADPTGQCPWCVEVLVGAAIGGGSDLAFQVVGNLSSGCPALSNISWGEVGTSAVTGATFALGFGALGALSDLTAVARGYKAFATVQEELAAAAAARGPADLAGGMRALLAERAGFTGTGTRIIVDENLPGSWAEVLRKAGYDARSVSEMGLRGASDSQVGQLADQVGARVLTRDVGHDIGGGFGSKGIVIDSRVQSIDTILRMLEGD